MAVNMQNEYLSPTRISPNVSPDRHGIVGRVMVDTTAEHNAKPRAIAEEKAEIGFWGKDGFSFGDLIDLVNPLQHIPVVSSIYRAVTGDEIGIGPRLLGGAAFGGIVGFGLSAMNAALEYETGKDAGKHILLAMGLEDEQDTQMASLSDNTQLSSMGDSSSSVRNATKNELSLQALTEEQAARLLLAQAGMNGNAHPFPASNAMHNASQRYQQIQAMDALQDTAQTMDMEG